MLKLTAHQGRMQANVGSCDVGLVGGRAARPSQYTKQVAVQMFQLALIQNHIELTDFF